MCNICNDDFVHLHGHSKYSVRDSISLPKRLAKKAKAMGQTAIALTDHGIASGWIEMAKACKEEGIKFIPGTEIYETFDRTIKTKAEAEQLGYTIPHPDGNMKYHFHFLMLPKDNDGLKNLNRIISDASLVGRFSGNNRTDMDTIKKNGWGKGIIATTACLSSRTSLYILNNQYDKAKAFALECSQIFDEFYLELQDNNVKDQYIVNQALIQMSQETGLPLVFTADYHYVEETDADMHDNWVCIGWGAEKEPGKMKYNGGPYHLASTQEMYKSVEQGVVPEEAFRNTKRIADSINVEFDFSVSRFPKYPFIPTGYNADGYLHHIAMKALHEYLIYKEEQGDPVDADVYIKRLDYELEVIKGKGFSDYFLILDDVFDFCRKNKIRTGPGRGSGAGSLVNFVLEITKIDPIEHKLLFERFLNPERMSNPDVDFDTPNDRREEVFLYIRDRFGSEHVAQIITYGQIKLKSGIDHLARIYREFDENNVPIKYTQEDADILKKAIPGGGKFPDQTQATYDVVKALANPTPEEEDDFQDRFRDAYKKLHQQAKDFMLLLDQYPELHHALKEFEGLVDNYGRHAAAVVITDDPITDYIPVYESTGILPVTAFNMKEVDEDLQMLKLDALALKTLAVVQKAEDLINVHTPDFKIDDIPFTDKATYDTIRKGNTTGVFQLVGKPITGYTKQVNPVKFSELTDILALYRPGPLEAEVSKGVTMADQYIINANADELDHYMGTIPEDLQYIYEDTRGILIYQEQLLELCQAMAGYTLGGADALRKATGKKDHDLIDAIGLEFVYGSEEAIKRAEAFINNIEPEKMGKDLEARIGTFKKHVKDMKKRIDAKKPVPGAIANGYDEAYTHQLYDGIKRFAGYSFNKSHSAAYAALSFQTAYLKTHYPVEFMCAQLTVEADDVDSKKERKVVRNIEEARRLNIKILPPDINKSQMDFSIEEIDVLDENGEPTGEKEKAIRYNFLSIIGIGIKAIEEIMARPARDGEPDSEGQPYTDLDDFYNRVNRRTINKGSFERLVKAGCFDYDIENRYTLLNHYAFNLRKDKEFLGTKETFDKRKDSKYKGKDKIKADTSFRFSAKDYGEDVLCDFEQDLFGLYLTHHPYAELPYENWDDVREREEVDMGGKITAIKKIKTKKGDNMCFLTVDTTGGKIDVTVFPNKFTEYQTELFKGNIAIFRGKKQTSDQDKASLLLDKVLKAKKKKFKVAKPPELEELAKQRKQSKKGQQLDLEDFGEVAVRPDPLAQMFNEPLDGGNSEREDYLAEIAASAEKNDKQTEDFDLASLFE